ncbi:flagellar type III secretion system pore protein FliP [Marinobacteraceae bacterium S3BR75-40.1]
MDQSARGSGLTLRAVKPLVVVLLLLLALFCGEASAAPQGLPAVTVTETPDGGQQFSVTLQILALMTALSFLPSFVMMMTSFTRIIVVFAILRQAIGLQSTPSNQILIGLALFLSIFIMAPVLEKANEQGLQPYLNEEMAPMEAVKAVSEPFRDFMLEQTREKDLAMFVRIADKEGEYATPEDVSFWILMPAFVTSELKTAFQIGFMLFIPFLIIDMVVASVLMAMGMMMLSPIIISLPFKIMLFVLVDGWSLIMGTLAASYGL